MGTLKWYKRDPEAALSGMMVLTLEERGAYNTVLDLIYSHDNNLIDDDRFIAGWLRCDVRVWRRIKMGLVDKGKIELKDGLVTNFRATSEIDEALSRVGSVSDLNRIKGIKSGIARRKNKDLAEPTVEPKTNTTTTTTRIKKEEDTPIPPKAEPLELIPARADDAFRLTVDRVVKAWNLLAAETKIPTVQRLSDARTKKLMARLKDIGGLEGWFTLIDKIRNSRYLCGQAGREWCVSFDWVLIEGNLTKIMEGNYDDKQRSAAPAKPSPFADAIYPERSGFQKRERDP